MEQGCADIVRTLLVEGRANPNGLRTMDGVLPLNLAAHHGFLDVAQVLLDNKAQPDPPVLPKSGK